MAETKPVRDTWRVNEPAPRVYRAPIRSLAMLRGWDMEEVVRRALEALAKQEGVSLPPVPRNSTNQWAGNWRVIEHR